MRFVLLTHYYPPESNAPASRAFEHAKAWQAQGHEVVIVTAAPSHPKGVVYPGYANQFSDEIESGIRVIRLPTLLAANRGIFVRSVAFFGFFASVWRHRKRIPDADAVISTSPQFFCGLAGILLRRPGTSWVLEIRDLWPESIVAVGAMRRNPVVLLLEVLEGWAYRKADLVVTTTEPHREHVKARAPKTSVEVIANGVTPGVLAVRPGAGAAIRDELGLGDRFVAAYFGTHGMAHKLETVVEAAQLLRHDDRIRFLLAGDGAAREDIEREVRKRGLGNILMLGQQPRERMAELWAVADAALVLLRRSPTFENVLPSKLVEGMSLGKPVILGVCGAARALLEAAGAGIAIPPEDATALATATQELASDREMAARMGSAGMAHVRQHYDRAELAARMADAIGRLRPC